MGLTSANRLTKLRKCFHFRRLCKINHMVV